MEGFFLDILREGGLFSFCGRSIRAVTFQLNAHWTHFLAGLRCEPVSKVSPGEMWFVLNCRIKQKKFRLFLSLSLFIRSIICRTPKVEPDEFVHLHHRRLYIAAFDWSAARFLHHINKRIDWSSSWNGWAHCRPGLSSRNRPNWRRRLVLQSDPFALQHNWIYKSYKQ